MELKEYLSKFEERLVEHDKSREEVQSKVQEICSGALEEADALEERVSGEICKPFEEAEAHIYELIGKLNEVVDKLSAIDDDEGEEGEGEGGGNKDKEEAEKELKGLINKAQKELLWEYQFKLEHVETAESFEEAYKFTVAKSKDGKRKLDLRGVEDGAARAAFVVEQLEEHLQRVSEAMSAVQEELAAVCSARRCEAEELEKKINGALEPAFAAEDERIQSVVKPLREGGECESPAEVEELLGKARAAFVKAQRYGLSSCTRHGRLCEDYELLVTQEASLGFIGFEERAPTDVSAEVAADGKVALRFAFFNKEETALLRDLELPLRAWVMLWKEPNERPNDNNNNGKSEEESDGDTKTYTTACSLEEDGSVSLAFRAECIFAAGCRAYRVRVRFGHCGLHSKWSCAAALTPPVFGASLWKECPEYAYYSMEYSVAEGSPRVATKRGGDHYSTVIGTMSLPPGEAVSWGVKVLVSRGDDGVGIFVGVAPSDISQVSPEDKTERCGWYFDCYDSTLRSGPPHNYRGKEYGPRKGNGEYVHTGDSVGVVVDTAKGELSFVVGGVNRGVAYEGIPLDKPLVPCVLLGWGGDSVELEPSGAAECVNSALAAPGNVSAESGRWDAITLAWDAVGGASSYQVEVDGSVQGVAEGRTLTKEGLAAGTEHVFRVRCVAAGAGAVGPWGSAVKKRSAKKTFETSVWKECPRDAEEGRQYLVWPGSPRVATKAAEGAGGRCTIVGDTPLPAGKVPAWRVRVLASQGDDGAGIFVGVAPSDIGQDVDDNAERCGWYFYCYDWTLYSGPPHNCREEGCVSRKKRGKKSVRAGSVVEVVVNTAKGDVSFVVDGVKINNAYKGVPLDEPLVPCVILGIKDDSVEIDP